MGVFYGESWRGAGYSSAHGSEGFMQKVLKYKPKGVIEGLAVYRRLQSACCAANLKIAYGAGS
jgi:hypothetical protein